MTTRVSGYGHLGRSALDDVLMGNLYDHGVVMRLAKYALPYKFWVATSFIGMAGHIVTMVMQPLIIGWAINNFVDGVTGADAAWGNLEIAAILFIINVLFNMLFNFMQLVSLARVTVNVLHDLRTSMFDHLQNQATSFYDRNEVGRIMSRIQNDVFQLQEFMDVGITTIGDIMMLLFIAGTMIYLDPLLGIVTLSVIPFLGVILIFWQKKSRPTFLGVRVAISAVNGNLQENVSGVRVTQSTNRQDKNLTNFNTLNQTHLNRTIRASFLSASLMPVVETLTVVSMGLVVVVGGIRVFDGALEIGFLVAFLIYVQRFFEPIRTLTLQYTMFQRAMASGARIFEMLDISPEMQDKKDAHTLPPIRGEIVFDDVCFGYTSEEQVLHNINLTIEPGQNVALVGLTGAGKTSLVALMHRFYDVTGGSIRVDGYDVRDVTRESLAGQMSMVLQEPLPLLDEHPRQHPLRPHGGHPRAGGGRRPGRRRARVHHGARPRLRHDAAAARQQPEHGPATAHQLRQGRRGRPAHHRAGRGDRQHRLADGEDHPGEPEGCAARPHVGRHRAPAVDYHQR